MVIGKSIVVASITYPNLAHEAYQNLSFLDSLSFSMSDSIAINEISVHFLKNELMVNGEEAIEQLIEDGHIDRKSTRLNSSHVRISYAVFCLKKKKKKNNKINNK